MTLTIVTSIEHVGAHGRAVRLHYDDTSRVTSLAVVKELGLSEGATLDTSLLAETESRLARERLLRLVTARERSLHDLSEHLLRDGYPSEIVQTVCARFVELGLIDDARFASMIARARFQTGYGRRRVFDELRRHGVDESVARTAIEEECQDPSRLSELIQAAAPQTPEERERTLRRLVRRGFDMPAVLSALDDFTRSRS